MISSISESYYKLEAKKKGLGILFTLICWGLVFILVPNLLIITKEPYQFLIFLAGGGLGFVGAAPLFKIKPDRIIHCLGACVCLISILIWSILNCFYIPIITVFVYLMGTYMYMDIMKAKYNETNPIFWIEITIIATLALEYLKSEL